MKMLQGEAVDRLEEIAEEMQNLVDEAREIVREFNHKGVMIGNADAYVFEHLNESIENQNRYNQSIMSLANAIRDYGEDEEEEA